MSGFLSRWARRKAQAAAQAGEPELADGQAEAPPPELDLDHLRSLWAANPTIGQPDGLDLDCDDCDAAAAEKSFSDLWIVGRRIEREMAEAEAGEQSPASNPPLV